MNNSNMKLSGSSVRIKAPKVTLMTLERANGDLKLVLLDAFNQLMQ